jgi:hypothetical protein
VIAICLVIPTIYMALDFMRIMQEGNDWAVTKNLARNAIIMTDRAMGNLKDDNDDLAYKAWHDFYINHLLIEIHDLNKRGENKDPNYIWPFERKCIGRVFVGCNTDTAISSDGNALIGIVDNVENQLNIGKSILLCDGKMYLIDEMGTKHLIHPKYIMLIRQETPNNNAYYDYIRMTTAEFVSRYSGDKPRGITWTNDGAN